MEEWDGDEKSWQYLKGCGGDEKRKEELEVGARIERCRVFHHFDQPLQVFFYFFCLFVCLLVCFGNFLFIFFFF